MISHWDEVEYGRRDSGHIGGEWASLTGDNSVTVGVTRMRIDPGKWSTPAHIESSEEEIFYVLAGSGISWQEGECYEVGPGDCLVHWPGAHSHTLRASESGLDVLAFGERHSHSGARLPRAGVSWGLGAWVRTGAPEDHPWKLEAEAGEPELSDPSPRPARIVNVDEVEDPDPWTEEGYKVEWRNLGRAVGSERTGLRWVRVDPQNRHCPPHVHSAEEEIFVVLEGSGTLELTPAPTAPIEEVEAAPVRAGSVVARPAGTRIAHSFIAGGDGLVLLAYGTRDPADVAYYPRSRKIYFRGVGVMTRVDPLDYWDGEVGQS
ncbi:MAG: cupin domain-containing protein [Actinobacteria bacterium]|nr:cupin domain-containing protein [Actinomycetota bacterium]